MWLNVLMPERTLVRIASFVQLLRILADSSVHLSKCFIWLRHSFCIFRLRLFHIELLYTNRLSFVDFSSVLLWYDWASKLYGPLQRTVMSHLNFDGRRIQTFIKNFCDSLNSIVCGSIILITNLPIRERGGRSLWWYTMQKSIHIFHCSGTSY